MTTSTDNRIRSHLRTLAQAPTRPAEEIERDVLDRVTRRRRRRRQRVVLGGTAVIALLAAATMLIAALGDSDTGDVKMVEKQRAASTPGKAAVEQLINMVEIQRFYPDPTERVTIEFDAPLPDEAVTQADAISDIDVPGIAVVIQDTSAFTVCETRHWDATSPPRAHVNILFPASWFEDPEGAVDTPVRFPGYEFDPPVHFPGYENEGPSQQGTKVGACGPYGGYVHVAIWGAQSGDVEVSVQENTPQVVVEMH